MSGPQEPPPLSAGLVDLYEAMRRSWCGGDGSGRMGLSLLLRQGMSAWMRAAPVEAATRPPSGAAVGDPGLLPSTRVAEVASILAAMAWGAAKEATT